MKRIFTIIVGVLSAMLLFGCGIRKAEVLTPPVDNNVPIVQDEPETTTTEAAKNTFGSTIVFDDLEITSGTDYHFETLSNEYSDLNGRSVIVLPVTVKNLKEETHSLNMFYYTFFGSQGQELDMVSTYFMFDGANVVDFAGDLRPGASYESNFYFLYDGDGTYVIEFDNWSSEVEAEFDIVMQ